MKMIREAHQIRQRLLSSSEKAEGAGNEQISATSSPTWVLGPTGVEMAGALSELGRLMMPLISETSSLSNSEQL
ncbi:hypothetical protein ACQKKX_08320 [Neorhizobium sp. NPDC001467]|uniref:hypothetical protein n=1 Tax=Neorhizobium sp. NPDC001467 TaxID=3390595 RepID=UPI003CFF5E21